MLKKDADVAIKERSPYNLIKNYGNDKLDYNFRYFHKRIEMKNSRWK